MFCGFEKLIHLSSMNVLYIEMYAFNDFNQWVNYDEVLYFHEFYDNVSVIKKHIIGLKAEITKSQNIVFSGFIIIVRLT